MNMMDKRIENKLANSYKKIGYIATVSSTISSLGMPRGAD